MSEIGTVEFLWSVVHLPFRQTYIILGRIAHTAHGTPSLQDIVRRIKALDGFHLWASTKDRSSSFRFGLMINLKPVHRSIEKFPISIGLKPVEAVPYIFYDLAIRVNRDVGQRQLQSKALDPLSSPSSRDKFRGKYYSLLRTMWNQAIVSHAMILDRRSLLTPICGVLPKPKDNESQLKVPVEFQGFV